MSKGKVVVVGGGVVGLSSAYYLNQDGWEVEVIDQSDFQDGTSFGNAGMIVPSHFIPLAQPGMIAKGIRWMFDAESPFYVKPRLSMDLIDWGWKFYRHSTKKHVADSAEVLKQLNLESKKLYQELSGVLPSMNLHPKGLIMFCKSQHALDEEGEVAEQAKAIGLQAEVMTQDELMKLDPNISLDVAGGVYFGDDAFFTPGSFMQQLRTVLQERGVKFTSKTVVTGAAINGGKVKFLETSAGVSEADQYVMATGAWSGQLAKSFGLKVPMQAGKGYSFVIPDPVEMPGICSILTEAKVAVTPMDHGLRFAGTMEIGGINNQINPRRVNGIKKSIASYFPKFKEQSLEVDIWTGLRPCSPDGLPYIGRTRKYDNLLLATGHGMMGMSMGPVTGKLISEIADERNPSIFIEQLDVNRFS